MSQEENGRFTISDLVNWPKNSVGTKEAADLIGCSRWGLSLAAKQGRLAIPHTFSGNRLHISKAGLLAFLGYRIGDDGKPEQIGGEARDWFSK